MADISLNILAKADVRDLRQLKETIEDSADVSEDFKRAVDDALDKAENGARLTNREFADLKKTVQDVMRQNGGDLDSALKDVKDAAERAGLEIDDLDGALERIGESIAPRRLRDIKEELEKVERGAKDLDGTNIDIDIDVDKDGRAKRQFDEVKDEAHNSGVSSAQEFSSSLTNGFDGEGFLDAFNEVIGEATEGLGGVAAFAGPAVAAGLAILYSQLSKAAEKVNELKTKAGEIGTEMVNGTYDAMEAFQEWAVIIQDNKSFWEVWQDEAVNNLDAVAKAAEASGQSFGELAKPFVNGDLDAANQVLEDLRDEQQRLNDVIREGTIYGQDGAVAYTEAAAAALGQADAIGVTIDQYNDFIPQLEEAHTQAVQLKAAQEGLTIAQAEEAMATEEATKKLHEFADALADLHDDVVSAEEANLDLADSLVEAAAATADATKSEGDRKRAALDLMRQIEDTAEANAIASGSTKTYTDVVGKNRAALESAMKQAGYTKDEIRKLTEGMNKVPEEVVTKVTDNGTALTTKDTVNRELGNIRQSVGIDVTPNTSGFVGSIQEMLWGRSVSVPIRPSKEKP